MQQLWSLNQCPLNSWGNCNATSAAGVVTVTCKLKGEIGNFITLSQTGDTMTLGNATLENGTGGPSGTATNYSFT